MLRPDVDFWNARTIGPEDFILVAEVVSPSSVSTDQIAKRAQYAAEGIKHYWIVETDPELRITVLTLPEGSDVYAEVGSWSEGETLLMAEPFPVSFAVADLRG